MSNWKKEPAIEGELGGCLNCGVRPSIFPPDGLIAVGFGYAGLHKDHKVVYAEAQSAEADDDREDYMTGAEAEALAAADPDHDWRIVLESPLSGREYQRHGENQWVLISQNQGFA